MTSMAVFKSGNYHPLRSHTCTYILYVLVDAKWDDPHLLCRGGPFRVDIDMLGLLFLPLKSKNDQHDEGFELE